MERKYTDRDGEIWVKRDDVYVVRVRDGNIGGFFQGKGLTEVV